MFLKCDFRDMLNRKNPMLTVVDVAKNHKKGVFHTTENRKKTLFTLRKIS